MTTTMAITALVSSIGILTTILWSIVVPKHRIWPPPSGKAGPRFWLVWILIGLFVVSAVIAGIIDYGSLGLDGWAWRGLGLVLFVLGNAVAWWGVAVLGGRETTGMAGDLATEGPYRFTRNPQYIGDLLILVGFIFLANSWLAFWPSALVAISAILAPFAEEPWLERWLGDKYRLYVQRVPRYF